jgi:hypothetical protein
MGMEILEVKEAPADLLPDGVANSYPHLALFRTDFCTEGQMAVMLHFARELTLCDDVLTVRYEGSSYRAFCFANAYHANLFAVAFDALQFDARKGPALRLVC